MCEKEEVGREEKSNLEKTVDRIAWKTTKKKVAGKKNEGVLTTSFERGWKSRMVLVRKTTLHFMELVRGWKKSGCKKKKSDRKRRGVGEDFFLLCEGCQKPARKICLQGGGWFSLNVSEGIYEKDGKRGEGEKGLGG